MKSRRRTHRTKLQKSKLQKAATRRRKKNSAQAKLLKSTANLRAQERNEIKAGLHADHIAACLLKKVDGV